MKKLSRLIFKDPDQKEALVIVSSLGLLILFLIVGALLFGPILSEILVKIFGSGLGFREAAVISFFLTTILLIVFAITAGDGIFGELSSLLFGWFGMFVFLTFGIAYIF